MSHAEDPKLPRTDDDLKGLSDREILIDIAIRVRRLYRLAMLVLIVGILGIVASFF